MSANNIHNSLDSAQRIQVGGTQSVFSQPINPSKTSVTVWSRLANRSSLNIRVRTNGPSVFARLIRDRNGNGRVDTGEVVKETFADANSIGQLKKPNMPAGEFHVQIFHLGGRGRVRTISTAPPTQALATDPSSAFMQEVFQLTNSFRQQNGLSALTYTNQLATAAQTHTQNMAVQDFFSHTGKDGSSPSQRISATGYNWSHSGENIAAGYTTPAAVVQGWINSPGHKANMLNSNFTEMGVGYYHQANDTGSVNYNYYWTQVFAKPMF
jgi:uncharacterized protein YkwD